MTPSVLCPGGGSLTNAQCDSERRAMVDRLEALEAKCALLAASLRQSERETADLEAVIAYVRQCGCQMGCGGEMSGNEFVDEAYALARAP